MLKTDSDIASLTAQAIERQNAMDFPEATELFSKILAIAPNNVVAHYSLGYIYAQEEKLVPALKHLDRVIALRPDFALGHQARSIVKQKLNQLSKATSKSSRKGKAKSAPQTLTQILEAAQTLQQQSKPEAALDVYLDYMDKCDANAIHVIRYNASVILIELQRPEEARHYLEEAIADMPEFFQGYIALGTFLENIGQQAEAIDVWKKALTHPAINAPEHTTVHCLLYTNIGRVYENQRQYDNAETALQKSLELDPTQGPVVHHWLHLRQKQCKWPSSYGLKLSHEEVVKHASALTMLSISDDPTAQLNAAKSFVKEKVGHFPRMVDRNKRYGHDRVRIGYLSSDLSMHAVSLLTVELYETHDREKFEIHAFCWSKEDGTGFRERVRKAFDCFHLIGALDDDAAAKLIAENEIDVLIDLQGLTAGARPNILARGPAPIQISWLGFPGPCAIPYVDYIVADPFIFPEALKKDFTEKPLYLETLYQVSDSQREVGPTPTRAALGIPEDKFVFCAFNNNYKITPEMFESWMRILRATPNSVIWLLQDNAWSRENLTRAACAHGVNPDRLFFAGRVLPRDYLARFKAADLFLDTTPYNAGTTANDVMWAGLPLLTLSGRTYVSRMAGSLLRSTGLEELITFTHEAYEAKAIELSNNPKRIDEFKQLLTAARENGHLFSTQRFCNEFEAAILTLCPQSELLKKKSKFQPSSKFRLLVRGWRDINHSYALVNQYQLAEMTKDKDIEIFHEDLPYISSSWSKKNNSSGFDKDTQARLEQIKPYQGQRVDACYSISSPIDLFRGTAKKITTFIVTEYGLKLNNFSQSSQNVKLFTENNKWVVTPTNWTKNKLANFGLNPDRIKVIPHGIEPLVFRPYDSDKRQEVRQSLGLKPEYFTFLNVGGSFWNKGGDLLLRAFCEIRLKNPNVRLILKDNRQLYGISSESILSRLAAEHPHLVSDETISSIITIPGTLTLNQLADLYNLADLYVSPYRAEGFNMPVIEAIACGLPVLVTDGGATDDFVGLNFGKKITSKIIEPNQTNVPVDGSFLEPEYDDLLEKMKLSIINCQRTTEKLPMDFHWENISGQLLTFLKEEY